MSGLMQLPAISSRISIPFKGFENSVVLFNILSYDEISGNTFTAMVISPGNRKVVYEDILFVGYSQENENVTPLNTEEIICVLNQLQKYSEGELARFKLNLQEINRAKYNIKTLCLLANKDTFFLRLTKHISVLYNENVKNKNAWNFEIIFNENQSIRPFSLNYIGAQKSNDILDFTFNIENIGLEKFKLIHFLDEIKIYIDSMGKGKTLEYTGTCTKVHIDKNNIKMTLNPANFYIMEKSLIRFLSTEKANPINLLYFIARSSGLPRESIKIEGFNWEKKYIYTIQIPVINLIILKDSIGVGNVTFYPFESTDIETEKFVDILKKENERLEGFCWAQIYVEGNNPYDAYIEGQQQISRSLDTLMHVVRSDSTLINYSTEYTLADWDKDNMIPKPSVTSWLSIHSVITDELIITNVGHLILPSQLVIEEKLAYRIANIEWYEKLLMESWHNKTHNSEPLFNALKWVKKSWDSIDRDDKIINSVIALEFVVAGERATSIIPREYYHCVKNAALDSFTANFNGEEKDKQEYSKKLSDKMAQILSDAPLFIKLDNLIKRLEIPIREQDLNLLKEARQIRNDLVHGRESKTLTNEEIWKLNNIINTIVAHKMFSLKSGL
jgi:hypothetical protein